MMKALLQLPKWLLYSLILPLIVLNGWLLLVVLQYFRSLITIAITATLLSFILDYPVKLLENLKIKRFLAIIFVLLFVVSALFVLGLTLLPIVFEQSNQLLEKLPSWLSSGSTQLQSLEIWLQNRNFPISVSNIGVDIIGRLSTQLQQLSGQILGSFFSAVSSVLDILLTIILTFYLLLQGQELWNSFFRLFNSDLAEKIQPILQKTFHNYFVGQITVAAIMGSAITTAFLILQIPFGLLFGIAVGVMAIFPFGGALSISLISFLVALKSIWLGIKVLVVAVIIEQIVENAIAPRLLGEFTGLNPALILLSLLAGSKIAGFLGLILAVPLASLIRNLMVSYTNFSSESMKDELVISNQL